MLWQIWESCKHNKKPPECESKLNEPTHGIWGPVIWDGRALTDLGSGVGQRRTPFWSNMAYLTGLGWGRVQSTAWAALTMTALWQVYLRWSCLMYAHHLLALCSPWTLSHPPSLPLLYRPISPCFISFTFPSLSSPPATMSVLFFTFQSLFASLSTPISLPMTLTAAYYLQSISQQSFSLFFNYYH